MAFNRSGDKKERKDLVYQVMPEFDFVLEEGRNTSINLRKVGWNGRPPKIDIRKWNYEDGGREVPLKGIGLTDDGAHELTSTMVEQGYGDTKRIVKAVKAREDYSDDMHLADRAAYSDDGAGDDYYDPKELFGE